MNGFVATCTLKVLQPYRTEMLRISTKVNQYNRKMLHSVHCDLVELKNDLYTVLILLYRIIDPSLVVSYIISLGKRLKHMNF